MKIEFYTDKAGEYRFRVRAANGEILASGEGYKNKKDRYRTITALRSGLAYARIEEVDPSSDGSEE